jgi:hypothetical protein
MAGEAERIEGRCLCGAVTVRGRPARPQIEACHCRMCRAWGGTAYLSVQCGSEVEIEGEEHVVRYRSSQWAERGFCGICGSNLFYLFLPARGHAFTAGLFPDDALAALGDLAEEIFIDEKPDYYAFAGERPRLTGAESIAQAKEAGYDLPPA